MTSESKILTVSYGTFSCTLEGFDDPFNTMKAIAEYFRDLAAEDRYFGAEPPVPDAAMLHRIAEREVQRMVEARVQDHGVFLRQHDTNAAPLPEAPAPVLPSVDPAPPAAIAEHNPAPTVADKQRVAELAQDDFGTEDESLPILHDIIPGGVAAKLARIRQSVNSPLATPVLTPETLAAFAVPPEMAPFDKASDLDLTAVETPVEALMESATVEAEIAEDAIADVTESDLNEPTSTIGPDFTDAEDTLSRLLAETDDVTPDVLATTEIIAAADDIPDEDSDMWLTDGDSDAVQTLPADQPTAGDMTEQDIGTDQMAGAMVDEMAVADMTEADLSVPDVTALDHSDLSETGPSPAAAEFGVGDYDDEDLDDEDFDDEDFDDATPAALMLSDTLRLTETAIEAQPLAEVADSLPEDIAEDDDADIAAGLADGFDAVDEADDPLDAADSAAAEATSRRASARLIRTRLDEAEAAGDAQANEDAEMSRLLRQADDEMADADNRRRLDAIAHLKAAVAATEAERAVTGEAMSPAGAKIEPYRDDLAQVVQPTDPEPDLPVRPSRKNVSVRLPETRPEPRPGTIRPGMIGPAPLVLVSEQRIDRTPPTGQPMVAVRSGRLSGAIGAGAAAPQAPRPEAARPKAAPVIASDHDEEEEDADDNIFVDEAGFTHFAEKVGVKSMADMLEAAAAYATCMEQRDQFTRPQLMRRLIASSAGKPVSREEGLRSFGTLLRTGRIEKVSRGHYALADNSPYLAEARRMAT
jgi:hypothetical protein